MKRWLHLAHAKVSLFHEKLDDKHLLIESQKFSQNLETKCSSDESWSMICLCVKSSFTTMLKSNLESILILLSSILISNWQSEFAKTLTSVSHLDIKLYVNHRSEKNKLLLEDRLLFQDRKKIETDENEIDVTVTTFIKEQKRLVVLTESKSYETHVKCIIVNQRDVWNEIDRSKRRVTLYDSRTCWDRILRDEFHMKKSRNSKIISILRAFKHRMHFVLWVYSSTSFEISSDDLDHYVKILKHSDEWKNEHILKSSDSEKVLSWGKSMFNALKRKHDVQMNDELQKIARKFDRFLTLLMIRRLSSMNWFNVLCMKLSSYEMQDVNCLIIEKYKEMHAKLENKTARSVKEELQIHVDDWISDDKKKPMSVFSFFDFVQISWQMRLCITFSYLVELKIKHNLMFIWTELVHNKWLTVIDNCFYDDNIKKLYESSSKLQQIMKILNKSIVIEDNQRERILIMFFSSIIANIIWLIRLLEFSRS